MIQIPRSRLDENDKPIRPPDSWFSTASTKTTEAETQGEDHTVDSNVYGHDELRRALLKLFHKKCAYCESKIAGIFDWEVEHYRPKGRVAESTNHPGYYWLAYTWENLYTGCTFCNQRRRDRGTWEDPQGGPTAGKLDQFPLSNESKRAMDHNEDISKEEDYRLLIDPCEDEPETELTFDIKGDVIPIGSNERATKTRDVLHLDRSDLKQTRKQHINFIFEVIKDTIEEMDPGNETVVRDVILKSFAKSDRPYAGLVRAIQRDPIAFGFS